MSDMSTGQTLFVLAIVLGCFAVLWPKIFSPMMFENYDRKIKPDRLPRPGPEFGHPALRGSDRGRPVFPGEEGRTLRRTIDKELKPGPVPGMRPSMGGPGIQPQAAQRSQGGSMGILMPLYTIGIVVFFVYTVLKIVFKKKDENEEQYEQQAKLAHQYVRLDSNTINSSLDNGQHFQKVKTAVRLPPTADIISPIINQVPQTKVFHPEVNPKVNEIILGPNKMEEVIEKKPKPNKVPMDSRDEEILLLKQRLEETERAMKMIFDQIAKTPVTSTAVAAETVSKSPVECDLDDENAGQDDENSSTESVEALSDNPRTVSLPQPIENGKKMVQPSGQIDKNASNNEEEEDSDPCTCSNEVDFDNIEETGIRRRVKEESGLPVT